MRRSRNRISFSMQHKILITSNSAENTFVSSNNYLMSQQLNQIHYFRLTLLTFVLVSPFSHSIILILLSSRHLRIFKCLFRWEKLEKSCWKYFPFPLRSSFKLQLAILVELLSFLVGSTHSSWGGVFLLLILFISSYVHRTLRYSTCSNRLPEYVDNWNQQQMRLKLRIWDLERVEEKFKLRR